MFLICNSYCSSLVVSTVVNVHVAYCIERSYANSNDLQVMKVVRPNFFFFWFYSGPMDDACFNNPIGVADKNKIHKTQMKASSGSKNGRPWHGRLNFNKKDGWCPKNNDKPWLQVNFTKSFQVCGVATQGDRNGTKWTIEFTLSFSNDSNEWSCYKNDNGEEMVRDKNVTFNDRVMTGIA